MIFLKIIIAISLKDRYIIEELGDSEKLLSDIAEYKKCIKKGGEIDLDKACKLILDDFRSGKLGRISLETPSNIE